MAINECIVQEIVQEVTAKKKARDMNSGQQGVFPDLSAAAAAAKRARAAAGCLPSAKRERIISRIRQEIREHAEILARMSVEETGAGNVTDRTRLFRLIADSTPGTEEAAVRAWKGRSGLTLAEKAPYGVTGSIVSCLNPGETILCQGIGMLSGGNTAVFLPPADAVKISAFSVDLLNRAFREEGVADIAAAMVEMPSAQDREAMLRHPDIGLVVAEGDEPMAAFSPAAGKRIIGAGRGNAPVLVDRTADLRKAAHDIADGASFDNHILSVSEGGIVAVSKIADELLRCLVSENNCYLASGREADVLAEMLLPDGKPERKYAGKSAGSILAALGIDASPDTRCIVFEGKKEHPLLMMEQRVPVVGLVKAEDFEDALETAVWLEHGRHHSAVIHSGNEENAARFFEVLDTAVAVRNAPSYAGLGLDAEGPAGITVANLTGEGLISAGTFTRERRVVLPAALTASMFMNG